MHLVNCKTQLYFFNVHAESLTTDTHMLTLDLKKSHMFTEPLNSSSISKLFFPRESEIEQSCLYKTYLLSFFLSFYHISSLFFQLSCLSLSAFFYPTRRNGRCNPVWCCAEDH